MPLLKLDKPAAPLLIFLLCLRSVVSLSQPTDESLELRRYQGDAPSALLSRLPSLPDDSSKVRILIKIANVYYFSQSITESYSDSTRYFAKTALSLATTLKDVQGANESKFILCKEFVRSRDLPSATELAQTTSGQMRVRLFLILSEYFINMASPTSRELDSAYTFLSEAKILANQSASRKWIDETLMEMGKYYFERGDLQEGKNSFLKIIRYYQNNKDLEREANYWRELERYTPDADSTLSDQVYESNQAISIYHQLGLRKQEAECMFGLATAYTLRNRYSESELLQTQALAIYKDEKVKSIWKHYAKLADLFLIEGNSRKALEQALLSVKTIPPEEKRSNSGNLYRLLGSIYDKIQDTAQSLRYYNLSLDNSGPNDFWVFETVNAISRNLISQNQGKKALDFLDDINEKNPPRRPSDKVWMSSALGNYYESIHKDDQAERYYIEMVGLQKDINAAKIRRIGMAQAMSGPEVFYTVARFYASRRNYHAADDYIKAALDTSTFSIQPEVLKDIRLIQFVIDSARGKYISSIRFLQEHGALKDSLTAVARNREVSELSIEYETSQKELQIQLLQRDAQLQKDTLSKTLQTRKITLSGIFLLLIILAIVYRSFWIKKKNNQKLESQQSIINGKNESLQQLVEEKEWLLREVHHRVKNNLQIIVSLLSAQSDHLVDEASSFAIKDSLNRVQAMSMLHQRIYQSEILSTVSMPPYVHEVIKYLNDSFSASPRIAFVAEIEEISMDLAKAIPIGLILNESITNAIKYAFPAKTEGSIKVRLGRSESKRLVLSIADNGVGLPADFDLTKLHSFGFKLIQGLSEDLGGKLTVTGNPGTGIFINFDASLNTK